MKKTIWFAFLFLSSMRLVLGADPVFQIYWIDSEGGGSTLFVTPAGESVLIDAGNPGPRDAGRIVDVVTNVAGLKQIDHLILTHFHADHFGGVTGVAAQVPVRNLWGREIPEGDPDGNANNNRRWVEQIRGYREFPTQRHIIKPGDEIPLKNSGAAKLLFRCLAAQQQFIQPSASMATNPLCGTLVSKAKDNSDNANSVVMLIECGNFRMFHGGDLTWNLEEKLVCPVNLPGSVDVYQVDHHGLNDSSNPLLMKSLQPTISVMNNGPMKGGPNPGVNVSLESAGSIKTMYQLHRNLLNNAANVTPSENIANADQDCKGNYIKLQVSASTREYTVTIPGTGHSKTYQTKLPK